MGWLRVDGGNPPPLMPGDGDFSEYYVLSEDPPTGTPTAPGNLTATAISSSQINLAWDDNSTDEDSFSIERDNEFLATVSPNVTSYSDTALPPSTEFSYRIAAVNSNGSSAYSNTANATTQTEGGDPTSVKVQSVVVSTVNEGKGVKSGLAVVTIVDDLNDPVNDAVVYGTFSGNVNGNANGTTDANGVASLSSNSTKPLNDLTFCVTAVTHTTLADYSGPAVCSSL